ncbi:MAG TPA: hypothetical protein PLZ57_11695 [Pseudobdellovibrionaceae bacterium]|mgnify:CR=1 FL=1|nr:hypothetical protein [Pseudobdellovibrionaceae bacterium]
MFSSLRQIARKFSMALMMVVSSLALTASAAPEKESAVLVTSTPLQLDHVTSRSVCGWSTATATSPRERVCIGTSAANSAPITLAKPEAFIMGYDTACALDGGQLKCWEERESKAQPLGEFLKGISVAQASQVTVRYEVACRPEANGKEVLCALPERSTWNRTTSAEVKIPAQIKRFGPFADLRRFVVDDSKLCALDGERITCLPMYDDGNAAEAMERVPDQAFPGARDFAMNYNGVCVIGDQASSCWQRDPSTNSWKSVELPSEWVGASRLGMSYSDICAMSPAGRPMCVKLDYRNRSVTANLPAELEDPSLLIEDLQYQDERLCVLDRQQQLRCFGYNRKPAKMPENLGQVARFASSEGRICALNTDGRVYCWSGDRFSRSPLPQGQTVAQSDPRGICQWNDLAVFCSGAPFDTDFSKMKRIVSLSHAQREASHSSSEYCVLWENGAGQQELSCFGSDNLSKGIPSLSSPVNFVVRSYGTACAVTDDDVHCWGSPISSEPQPNLKAVRQLEFGSDFACALDRFGMTCWGRDLESRQLAVPQELADFEAVQGMSVGENHVCVVTAERKVRCWGGNSYGQLNHPDLIDVTSVIAGSLTTCAAHSGGVTCWGYREGALDPNGTSETNSGENDNAP